VGVALTRDPSEPLAVAVVIAAAALAIAATVALVGVAIEQRNSAYARRRGRARLGPPVRRGIESGLVVLVLGFLRAIDGLSLVTGGFVLTGFVLAEIVLSARPASHSG
jgi:Zn-dependent membrane protease YugP